MTNQKHECSSGKVTRNMSTRQSPSLLGCVCVAVPVSFVYVKSSLDGPGRVILTDRLGQTICAYVTIGLDLSDILHFKAATIELVSPAIIYVPHTHICGCDNNFVI